MSEDFCKSPEFETGMPATERNRREGRALAVAGVSLLLSPLVGVAITVVSMIIAFSNLNQTGSADPSELAGEISVALVSTFVGSILAAIGTVLLGLALLWRKNREPWFLIWGVIALVIGALSNLLIIIPAIYFIYVFLSQRLEFRPNLP